MILRQTSGFLTSFWTNFERRLNHPSHGGFVRNTSERTTVQAMNEKKVMWWNCPSQKVEVASNEFSIGKSKPSSYFSSPKPPWLGFDSVGDHELSPRPRGTAFIAVLCVGDLGTHSKVMGLRSLYKSSLSPAEWSVWQFLDYESDESLMVRFSEPATKTGAYTDAHGYKVL